MKARSLRILFPLCALALICSDAAIGKVIYVRTSGLDGNDGTAWNRAKLTVQAGLNTAVSGDGVWVAAGVYSENITLKSGVALYGGFAGSEAALDQRNWKTNPTVLEGWQSGSVVTSPPSAGEGTRIDGFTIRKGKGTARAIGGVTCYCGGGVYCGSSSPTIINNTITGNTVEHLGGGIYCEDSSAVIRNNIIQGNSAGWNGAGIHVQAGSPSILNNVIVENTLTSIGTGGSQGGGIYLTGGTSPRLIANTIARNTIPGGPQAGGGLCFATVGSCTVINNIIAYNSSGIYSSRTISEHHNCVAKNSYFDFEGIPKNTGDVLSDPLFVDATGGNYHLQPVSPCMDAGLDDAVTTLSDWTDIDNQERTYGSHVDIGADEYWPPTVAITYPTSDGSYSTSAGFVSIAGSASDGVTSVTWQNDRGGSGACTGTTSWTASNIPLQTGQNIISVIARDDGGFAATDTLTVAYSTGALADVVFVKPDGNDSNDGSTWQKARRTIQAGINKAASGDEVWVAAGTYKENITLKNGVAVYGGFAGTESSRSDRRYARNATIIDGHSAGNAVKTTGDSSQNTRIDGFTIKGGGTASSGGIACYSSHCTIANCTITANTTTSGHGAGIYLSGGAVTVIGNMIIGNTTGQGLGGGVYCWSCLSGTCIVNNTIVGNESTQGGGIYTYNCLSAMTIANNVISRNSSGIHSYGTKLTLVSNDVYNNSGRNYSGVASAGDGDISVDPQFVDVALGNYHLKSTSPCVDSGWNSVPGLGSYDIDGQSRLRGVVDMGADEAWPAASVQITSPTGDDTFVTGSSALTLEGTAAEGTLAVTWSSDKGASGRCVGTTGWTAANVPLTSGANTITVTSDSIETRAQDVLVVYYDSGPPAIVITIPTAEASLTTTSSKITLGGTASDDIGVASVAWVNSRGGAGACSGTASWTARDIPLQTGVNLITVTAADAAGKFATDQIAVTFGDTTPPVVAITAPTSSPTYGTGAAKVTLSGTATDDVAVQSVTWSNDKGGSGTCTGTASWTAKDIVLQPGRNVITVTAADATGNSSTDTLTVTYDSTPPSISITSPTAGPTYESESATLQVSGDASDDMGLASVTWSSDRGGAGTCAGTSSWTAQRVALQPGENVITFAAHDTAGNTAAATLKVTFTDTTPPAVTITAPAADQTYSTHTAKIDVSGAASDDAGIAGVGWANDRGGSGACTGTTSWSAKALALQPGVNVITVTATDTSGNASTDTLTVTFTDSTNPSVTITVPTSDASCGRTCTTVTIAGTASDDAGIEAVTWSSDAGTSGGCTGTSTWSANDIVLQSGENVITVTARDSSGNTASDTIVVTCDLSSSPGSAWRGLAMVALPIFPDIADPKEAVGFAANYWVVYSPSSGYVQYPNELTWFEPASGTRGRGFWASFETQPPTPCGTIPEQTSSVAVLLMRGWNLIGQPYVRSVQWDVDKLTVRAPGGSEQPLRSAGDWVACYAWGWDTEAQEYYMVSDTSIFPGVETTMRPWRAYWIRAYKDCELVIPAP